MAQPDGRMSGTEAFTTDSALQVGIEIEFVAPHNTAWEDAHLAAVEPCNQINVAKDACFHRLAAALDDAGLPACYQMKTMPLSCPHNPLRDEAPEDSIVLQTYRVLGDLARYQERDGRAGLFRYWLVKGEYNLTEVEAYELWIMCELTTPIFPEADVFGALPALDTALGAVYRADEERPHIFPKRCGLHVHLSLTTGRSLFFTQRVLTLALLLDQIVLFPLCDPARRHLVRPFLSTATIPARDRAIPPLPSLSPAALAHLPAAFASSEGRILSCIWNATTFDHLQNVLEHHRAELVSVAPVMCKHKHALGGGRNATTTIEFRYAQASFSKTFVQNWARLVLAMGRVGVLPTEEYRAALERIEAAAGEGKDEEEMCMAALTVLNEAAVEAGILEGLDLEYWRRRYAEMRDGRNPDIDEEGKVVLDK